MGKPRGDAGNGRPPAAFVVLFVGFWSLITLVFDGVTVSSAVRQERARSYATAPAVILSSDLKQESGRHGPVYSAQITFRYSVGGREYTGTRWRYGQWSQSEAGAARAVLARYPVGGKAVAHYRPPDPGDAVLEVGVRGQDAFMALFLGPFNAVMLIGWCFGLGRLQIGPCAPTPLGGAVASEAGGLTRVRLHGFYPPVLCGLAAYGAASFVQIFIAAFAFRMRAPLGVVAGMVGGAALLGLVAWGVSRWRLVSGRRDLLIDPVRKVLTLPPRLGGGEVPFADIERVEVGKGSISSGGRVTSGTVILVTRTGKRELFESWTRAGAEGLAEWLRDRLAGAHAAPREHASAALT